MERTEILAKLQDIFRDVFGDEDIELTCETSSDDIEEWDSLSHIRLIVAIEKSFGFNFTYKETFSWENVGDMIDCIAVK